MMAHPYVSFATVFFVSTVLVFAFLKISRQRRTWTVSYEVLQPNTLPGLAIGLLLSISDFLEPEDITCLSLCSHHLFAVFHGQKRRVSPMTDKAKLSLPRRLERDRPSHFVRYSCLILHKFDGTETFDLSGPSISWNSRLSCIRNLEYVKSSMEVHESYSHSQYVSFLHVQLAMRRFFYGPRFGISTEALSYTEVQKNSLGTTLFSSWKLAFVLGH